MVKCNWCYAVRRRWGNRGLRWMALAIWVVFRLRLSFMIISN
jgi:hypothetical protein